MTQLSQAVKAVEEVMVRAQIRDAALWRGLRAALGVALIVAKDDFREGTEQEHKDRIRALLEKAEPLALDLVGIAVEDVEAMIDEVLALAEDAEAVFVDTEIRTAVIP